VSKGTLLWSQAWRDADQISDHLKRAVIASEDAGFVPTTAGIEWEALQNAWKKNNRAEERAQRPAQAALARHERAVQRA
jgi:monofunctional biosynthetic peptidoglycan transglycosylase